MQQKNISEKLFGDVQSNLEQALEMGRKNFQAVAEANQRALQGWQALARRQSEMVTQFLQDNSAAPFTGAATTEERILKQTDAIQSAYRRSIANSQELAEMVSKCTKDAADVISKRITASMQEINAAAKSGKQD